MPERVPVLAPVLCLGGPVTVRTDLARVLPSSYPPVRHLAPASSLTATAAAVLGPDGGDGLTNVAPPPNQLFLAWVGAPDRRNTDIYYIHTGVLILL